MIRGPSTGPERYYSLMPPPDKSSRAECGVQPGARRRGRGGVRQAFRSFVHIGVKPHSLIIPTNSLVCQGDGLGSLFSRFPREQRPVPQVSWRTTGFSGSRGLLFSSCTTEEACSQGFQKNIGLFSRFPRQRENFPGTEACSLAQQMPVLQVS